MGDRSTFQRVLASLVTRASYFFRTPSISARTFVVFAVMLTCVGVLGSYAYVKMNATAERLLVVRDEKMTRLVAAQSLADDFAHMHMKIFRIAQLAVNPDSNGSMLLIAMAIRSEMRGAEARLRRLTELEGQASLTFQQIEPTWIAYVKNTGELLEMVDSDPQRSAQLATLLDDYYLAIASKIQAASWFANKEASEALTKAHDYAVASTNWLAWGGSIGLAIGLLIAGAFARSIVKPVLAVTRAMRQISAGNVDVEVSHDGRTDEIGQMVEAIAAFRATAQQHVDTIATQNKLIDAALNNMSHGLVMFDRDERLIICNDRYLDMFGPAREMIAHGCTLSELLHLLDRVGVTTESPEECLLELRETVVAGKPARKMRTLSDGRTYAISRIPLPGGGWVATHEDVTERMAAEARIAHMARHDPLTDLPNRASLRDHLQQALARVHRGEMVALHYIDLDHFKNVNDTLGHLIGDELLKGAAGRLKSCVRETDIVARLGGDEFAVVQTKIERPNDAAILAQRIQEVIRQPFFIDGQEATVDASIGIAIAPTDGNGVEELVKSADIAVYAAKASGRSAYRFFELEMDERVKERRAIESGLRNALVNGEFKLYYQPIVNLQTNRISSFEALIRWFHPERGLIPPSDFIPVAEECGLIIAIGEWVMRQACHDAVGWPDDIKVAINLSPVQFNKHLVRSVVSALASAGLPPRRLELEVTESVLMQNTFATLATLNQLHELGVKFSMDDFGTGYSSLSYLRSFPFDKIKIDRAFVRDLSEHENSTAIIRAVTLLAKSLDMMTTVEGVETEEQLERIRALGCTEMQGYLYSPPRNLDEISAMFLPPQAKAASAA
jgi:diguanylate cyclase (GGDEF)-like protein